MSTCFVKQDLAPNTVRGPGPCPEERTGGDQTRWFVPLDQKLAAEDSDEGLSRARGCGRSLPCGLWPSGELDSLGMGWGHIGGVHLQAGCGGQGWSLHEGARLLEQAGETGLTGGQANQLRLTSLEPWDSTQGSVMKLLL